MMDKIPAEFWTTPKKVLEPCAGKGGFLVDILERFMVGLQSIIPNVDERRRVIVEDCLYWADINPFNVWVCTFLLNLGGERKVNGYLGDSLELDTNKEWGIAQFDAVVGNPPYQKENTKTSAAKGGTNNHLYLDFAIHGMKLLKPDGLLVFVHPLNWRKIGSKILPEFIRNRDLVFVALNTSGSYFANVSVKTDFYVLQNSCRPDNITTVEFKNSSNKIKDTATQLVRNEIRIPRDAEFIPNWYCPRIATVLHNLHTCGIRRECVITSDCHKTRPHVNKGQTEVCKYPLYNTSGNPWMYFSSRPHKAQYTKKVVLSNSGSLAPFYDDGTVGTTQDSMYFPVESADQGAVIVMYLQHPITIAVMRMCQWSNFRNEAALFSWLSYPPANTKPDEAELLAIYGISAEDACALGVE
jgi:hypothetical protein